MVTFKSPKLIKRGRGWQLYFYSPSGERRRLSAGTDPHLAQRMAVRFIDWLLEGKDPEAEIKKAQQKQQSRSMTLAEFFPVFIKRHVVHRSKNTQKSYRVSFGNISRCPALANAQLGSISKDLVLDYMAARLERDGISPGSANVEALFLKSLLSRASEWGLLEDNPLRGMRLFPVNSKRIVDLTHEEARELIGVLAEPIASIVEFAIYTGFRKENILSLRIESVRLHDLTPTRETELIVKGGRREVFPLLRHVFATWLQKEGVSLDSLRFLLGHQDRATTDRYANISRLDVGKALGLMPNLREDRKAVGE